MTGESIHNYIIWLFGALVAAIVWLLRSIVGNREKIAVMQAEHMESMRRIDELKKEVADGFAAVHQRLDVIYREVK